METVILSLLLSSLLTSVAVADDFQVDASISGYNLLQPTLRCCSFELHVNAAGLATISGEGNSEGHAGHFSKSLHLTSAQVGELKRTINESDFFHLPSDVCCHAVDADVRRITVTQGRRAHQVVIGDSAPIDASREIKVQRRRADTIWAALRSLADIPGYNLREESSNNAFKSDAAKATRS
jgi:hypothetical protein